MKNTVNKNIYIGLDIGTTYIKASCFDHLGRILVSEKTRSTVFSAKNDVDVDYAKSTYEKCAQLLSRIHKRVQNTEYKSIILAVCGISPVLVGFSISSPDVAISLPYWSIPEIDNISVGLQRTERRISYIRQHGIDTGINTIGFLDLIGYINFRLTNRKTMNSVTMSEFGLSQDDVGRLFDIPVLPPAALCGQLFDIINDHHSIFCCVGASDSFGTAFGVGASSAGDKMIYLGTFGSLLLIRSDLYAVCEQSMALPAYDWIFSVPHFGETIEQLATVACGKSPNSLASLDALAARAPAGAEGLLFHLPRLIIASGTVIGSFGFSPSPASYKLSLSARAILEGLPLCLMASGVLPANSGTVYIGGGGSVSTIWRQIISDCLQAPIATVCGGSAALGAGRIAYTNDQGAASSKNFAHSLVDIIAPNRTCRPLIDKVYQEAKSWYS